MLSELFVERFWMRRAEQRARGYTPAQVERIRRFALAARTRAEAGIVLRSPAETGAAFLLLKDAFALSLTAWLVARGEHDAEAPLTPDGAWQQLDALSKSGVALPSRDKLGRVFASDDPLAADRLGAREALAARTELEGLVRFAGAEIELRSVLAIRTRRVLRVLGVVVAFVVLLVATITFALGAPADNTVPTRARLHQR